VQIHKTFVYRLYPTAEQEQTLRRWEGVLRFVWNLAHEQRLRGLARGSGEKVYPSWYDQKKELTELRELQDWIKALPCNAQQQTLKHLDGAWQRFFAKLGGRPRFKAKGVDAMGIAEPDAKRSWKLVQRSGQDFLVFTKLGNVPVVVHRPLEGKAGTATLKRDGDPWFVSIVCDVEVPDHVLAPAGEVVGLDRGVANLVADSTGRLEPRPAFLDEGAQKIAKASREVSRKKKGSKNRAKAREHLAAVYRKVRRQREHSLHVLAKHDAKNHRVVVVEDLKIGRLVRSASGTSEVPGKNVAQKRSLNRRILQMGWGQFVTLLEQKAVTYGSTVVKVPAAYSSQTCAACGQVDAASRTTQARFVCTGCGHEEHADVNAASVLRQRYEERSTRRTGGVEVCGGDAVGRPAKQKPKTARSRTPRKSGAKSSGLQAGDGLLKMNLALPQGARLLEGSVEEILEIRSSERVTRTLRVSLSRPLHLSDPLRVTLHGETEAMGIHGEKQLPPLPEVLPLRTSRPPPGGRPLRR
jgi:putative transposase